MATSPHRYFEKPPILQLSQEIIDEIIDHVPEHEDLVSLSLVSQAFRPRCEKHLFTSISLSNISSSWSGNAVRLKEFIDILSRKPYIAGYIRELRLGVGDGHNQDWIVKPDPGFLNIMDLIRESATGFCIKRVELAGNMIQVARNMIQVGPARRIASPRLFAEFFCAPFITPFLSSLCIKDLDDVPITLVTGCPNLKSLDLIRTTFGGLDLVNNMNSTSQSYPQLQRLRFHRCTQAIDTLIMMHRQAPGLHPFINLSKLRIITTDKTWIDNVVALKGLLQVSSGSLEELHLEFTTDVKVFSGSEQLNLDTLIHLRVLYVDTFLKGGLLECYPDDLPSVCKLLNTISSATVLEDLIIHIFLEDTLTRPRELERANWAYLDHEVRRLSSGKPLKFHLNFFHNTTYLDGCDSESDGDDDDGDEDQYFNSSGYPENGGPVTTLDYRRALEESTFHKIVERQLPMIRSDPNIILHLAINPACPAFDPL